MKHTLIMVLLLLASCVQSSRISESCTFSLSCDTLVIAGNSGKIAYHVYGNPESGKLKMKSISNAATINKKKCGPAIISARAWNAEALSITFFGEKLKGEWLILNYNHETVMIKLTNRKENSIHRV